MNEYIENIKKKIESYKKTLNNVSEMEELATEIEVKSDEVQEVLLYKIQKLELFVSHYSICCKEYGKEIEISSKKDILVGIINHMYTMIRVPKVNLSLLCDSENNNIVFKKSLLGSWYSCNLFINGTSFYEISPSEVNFYPSVNDRPIRVCPFDNQSEYYIGFLSQNASIPHSKGSICLFNEPNRKIMIDDYDYHRLNNPLKDLFGTLPGTATIYKTIKLEEQGVQTTVAYLIDIDEATIQTDIVDTLSGKRYEVDKDIEQKDAINIVYERVLSELKQNYHNRSLVKSQNK